MCEVTKCLLKFKIKNRHVVGFCHKKSINFVVSESYGSSVIVMNNLRDLYIKYFNEEAESVTPIIGSGSDRKYFRLVSAGGSAIGVIGNDVNENRTFVYLAELMRTNGLNVPEIFLVSDDDRAYLQQDLGDVALLSLLHTAQGDSLVNEVMSTLPSIQYGLHPSESRLYPVTEMTREVALWDLHYFKYCFLKPAGVTFDEFALEDEFCRLIDELWMTSLHGLIYRDCQSRNIMVYDDKPWWIDFQSMRRGPVLYDVASFLWQARAGFSDEERRRYADVYYEHLPSEVRIDRHDFGVQLQKMALLRLLQVLGAYGLRGLTERKAHFIQSIPAALANVVALFDNVIGGVYPELERVLRLVASQDRFKPVVEDGQLHVKVFSFSYKKGYPEDLSGNGGGFMFDCRAMHNPGRYDCYKSLTGMDASVQTFLEDRGEVQEFLNHAISLVDTAVERYISRGFSSLQVGFGCTGGRHRSVYCAEHVAKHIASKFSDNVCVDVSHREQNINYTL